MENRLPAGKKSKMTNWMPNRSSIKLSFFRKTAYPLCIAVFAMQLCIAIPGKAQYRNYSLRCLAPLLAELDPNAPKTLHEAFLSGPKYLAEPIDGIGAEAISFPISTESEEAKQFFRQGIALLHTLSYKEAERAFRTIVHLDPDCPMGYWGLAQANERRPSVARVYAQAARDRCDRNRPLLEQKWTALLADFYKEGDERDLFARSAGRIRALDDLLFEFPRENEIRAFLIRRLTLDQYIAGLPVSSRLAVDTLAKEFFEIAPEHPSRHYRVFLWLDRRPEHILEEARNMISKSPNAAEIWRYAAEAFLAAGRSNEAAIFAKGAVQTDHDDLASGNRMPWESQSLAENHAALIRILTESGRINEALKEADAAIALSRKRADSNFGVEALRVEPLMISGQWERLANDLETHPPLLAAITPQDRIQRMHWQFLAHLALGNQDRADDILAQMLRDQQEALITGISNSEEKKITDFVKTAQTILSLFEAENIEANLLKKVVLPPLVKAYFLHLAGHTGPAFQTVEAERKNTPYRWLPTSLYCHYAMEAGRQREALFPFDRRFRADSNHADADIPVLMELSPIAQKLRLPGDWKLPTAKLEVGQESVGPDSWQPPRAAKFQLSDRRGNTVTLAQFSDRPVLLNFFLGTSCAYCLKQFDIFQPHYKAFEKTGIQIVAISLDSSELLGQMLGTDEEKNPGFRERFPFPVLADPELKTFRDYRIFDELENGPMHGTVLISPGGKILWQDIGHSPFSQPKALLNEAQRLLRVHSEKAPLQK